MDIIDFVRNSLNANKGTWPHVCEETKLDYSWLSKFAQGKIPNPGYQKVDALARHYGVSCAVPPEQTFCDD